MEVNGHGDTANGGGSESEVAITNVAVSTAIVIPGCSQIDPIMRCAHTHPQTPIYSFLN